MRSSNFWTTFGLSGKYKDHDANSNEDPLAGGDFTAEDIYACEQQQKSLYSPHYEVGPAAIGEGPILDHQNIILNWIEKRR